MKKFFGLMIMVLTASFLMGCAEARQWFSDNKTPLEYGIKLTVVELIEDGKVDPVRVQEITGDISSYLTQNPAAKAEDIVSYVSKAIDWDKLSSSQVIIVQSILAAAELKVATDIDRGILMADTVTSVREVVQWIDEAARLHKK